MYFTHTFVFANRTWWDTMPGSSPGHHSDFLCLSSQEDLGIVSFSRSDYIYGPCLLRNTPSPPAEDVFWGRRPGCPSGPGTYSADFAISHRSVWTFYVSFSRGVLLTVTSLWAAIYFYDIILTFPSEITFLWDLCQRTRRSSLLRLAYIFSRYGFCVLLTMLILGLSFSVPQGASLILLCVS